MELLGVAPGAVTVFGAINDAAGRGRIVIDQSLAAEALINAHPLVNTATTTISSADLLAFVRATGHDPIVFNLTGGKPHGVPTGWSPGPPAAAERSGGQNEQRTDPLWPGRRRLLGAIRRRAGAAGRSLPERTNRRYHAGAGARRCDQGYDHRRLR